MNQTSWNSYPKIYALGHAALKNLYKGNVIVEEKIDGSQFSFGIFNGEIKCKSKNKEIEVHNPDKMFIQAVETVKELAPILHDGWTYRAEYLRQPKHNTIEYARTPKKNLIIFDINDGMESYLNAFDKAVEADRLGLEVVPFISAGFDTKPDLAMLDNWLQRESILGNSKIEGVVLKNYEQFGSDKKVLMGKYVSEKFKEENGTNWKRESKPAIQFIIDQYKNENRWKKAIQHLKENGELTGSPKDIGELIKEVQQDLIVECKEDIKDMLWAQFSKKVLQGCISGFPEFYKRYLIEGE